ncbi:glutathione S-transferase family protein [Sphingobium sp. BS19]|uniref:glutathione S-transferase family protein n=1 Tax=Sphingobium sp. BS19 TaxID=3018973 RepID=UPI0022EE883F|nr:glutathione S-transferase family protein [Sphingobium sp. BS19]GLJ00454.1 glutathione S-transferase [Sphingobium sp. BS19]
MIEVYHLPPTRSVRAVWVLEELGIAYGTRNFMFPAAVRDPGYLDLNPAGTCPTMVDGDVVLTESMAICDYIARIYGGGRLIISPQDPDYFEYLRWMWYGEATLSQQLANVMHYGPNAPADQQIPTVVDNAIAAYVRHLAVVEKGLRDDGFIAGGALTLADVSLGYALFVGQVCGLGEQFGPRTARYFKLIAERPAFERACAPVAT